MEETDLGNQCWFCQEEKTGEIVPLYVTMTKKENDTKLTKLVTLPSCPKCNANHRKFARVQNWYTIPGAVFLLAIWVIMIVDIVKTDQYSYLFLIPITFLFYFFYTSLLDKIFLDRMKSKGTQPQSHLHQHPEIEAVTEQGWRFRSAKPGE